ncbi:MAG: IS110 family transposase [Lewinellaceae bacterium]|nr:IS110 family transposase [Lewinellaceae bacterium]
MKRFQNAKQLGFFIGICPRVFQSGSSVKGKNKICKLGMSHIRQLLYLCSMKAIKVNKSCQALYERLIANGNPNESTHCRRT